MFTHNRTNKGTLEDHKTFQTSVRAINVICKIFILIANRDQLDGKPILFLR